MEFREVSTLFLAFGWIRSFFQDNGIIDIPEYLAFVLESCGIFYWVLIFAFAISLLVGYSRQMSSFYFMYQYILGQKLNNPYKSSIIIVALWVGVQILATGITMGAVYLLKYGVIVAGLVGISTIASLMAIYFVSIFVLKKMSVKPPEPVRENIRYVHVMPAQEKIVHQGADQVIYLQGPSTGHSTGQHAYQTTSDAQVNEAMMILGLKPGFTKEELKSQYKKLIKKVHTDKGGSDGLYLKVKQSYEFLLSRIN